MPRWLSVILIRLSLSFKTLVFPLLRVIPFVPVRVCLTPGRGKSFWAIGVDTSGIGLHSLRIGGASAALNSGVADHVIKNHGRWKSDSAKNLYCRENLRRQLLATSRIGL